MKQSRILGLVFLGFMLQLASCGPASSSSSSDSEEDAVETPEQLAKENNAEAEAEMALSDKGVDEDGEKVWKQEAREYFDRQKNPMNRTFELSPQFAREYIEKMYGAGATKVWVTGIDETEIGGTKINMSDTLVVVLPTEPAKRAAAFGVYNGYMEEAEEPKLKDIGQKYIFYQAD